MSNKYPIKYIKLPLGNYELRKISSVHLYSSVPDFSSFTKIEPIIQVDRVASIGTSYINSIVTSTVVEIRPTIKKNTFIVKFYTRNSAYELVLLNMVAK